MCTIPRISTLTADAVVAETGTDMSRFPTAKHLASWAGTTPGLNELASKVKSNRTRPGNPYPQRALEASARSIARTPATYLNAKSRRIATRRGRQKANVASGRAARRDLAPGSRRHPLRSLRSRLPHPTSTRQSQAAGHPPARSHGPPRHARRSLVALSAAQSRQTWIFASAARHRVVATASPSDSIGAPPVHSCCPAGLPMHTSPQSGCCDDP
ncbi:transposase [Geodermatophilus sp. URMC 63]